MTTQALSNDHMRKRLQKDHYPKDGVSKENAASNAKNYDYARTRHSSKSSNKCEPNINKQEATKSNYKQVKKKSPKHAATNNNNTATNTFYYSSHVWQRTSKNKNSSLRSPLTCSDSQPPPASSLYPSTSKEFVTSAKANKDAPALPSDLSKDTLAYEGDCDSEPSANAQQCLTPESTSQTTDSEKPHFSSENISETELPQQENTLETRPENISNDLYNNRVNNLISQVWCAIIENQRIKIENEEIRILNEKKVMENEKLIISLLEYLNTEFLANKVI